MARLRLVRSPWRRLDRRALTPVPAIALVALACVLAWRGNGSIAAGDWLGYALAAALLLVASVVADLARRPRRAGLVAVGALVALALWAAISIAWAPLPSLARDEALLTALYALALAIPMLTLRRKGNSRVVALAGAVVALGCLTLATAVALRFGGDPLAAYPQNGRLYFPLTYVNAQAAIFLVGFWPAVALAARRSAPLAPRALWTGLSGAMLAGSLLTQSRGALIALVLSALVVFAVCPARLRLAPPTLIAAVPAAVLFPTLTGTFPVREAGDAQLEAAIRDAGGAVLWAWLAASLVGALYAFADSRIRFGRAATRAAGAGAALLVLAAAVGGALSFSAAVDEPRQFLEERWEEFKREPESEVAGTHLLNPGSNRWDFWRVALLEFRDHPLAGGGSRSFGPEYLLRGKSEETPVRAHSLFLEVLAENGLVGFLLLATALGIPLAVALRQRMAVPGAAAIGAGTYWLLHASVDWIWTFPACGIVFFALLGIALAGHGRRLRPRWSALTAGLAVLAAVAFLPPWLAARYTERALEHGFPAAAGDLRQARRLDPLSTAPLLAEARLATDARGSVAALREAVALEPRSVRAHYLLGLALLRAGDREGARAALLRADALFPREPQIDEMLALTR